MRGHFSQNSTVLSDMRALTSAIGAPVAWVRRSICGQISLSTNIAASGCQWARNRFNGPGASSGANWCRLRGGRRWSTSLAEVAVPDVIRKCASGSMCPMRVISASTDRLSPTEAACTQTSAPIGRGCVAMPRFSPARVAGTSCAFSLRASALAAKGIRQRLARTQARYRKGADTVASAACVAHVAGHLPIQLLP